MFGTQTSSSIGQIGFISVERTCRLATSNNGVYSKSCGIVPTTYVAGSTGSSSSIILYDAPALVPFSDRDIILIGCISGILIILELVLGVGLICSCKPDRGDGEDSDK